MKSLYNVVTFLAALAVLVFTSWQLYANWSDVSTAMHKVMPNLQVKYKAKSCTCSKECDCDGDCKCKKNDRCNPDCNCK